MSTAKKRRGRKKRNPGWFQKGFDARRSSYRFTAQDCRIGYLVAAIKHPELREWLKMRIRCFYHRKETGHGDATPKEDGFAAGSRGGNGEPRDTVPW